MSKASVAEFGRGLGQGFINAANVYVQHKQKEAETSKVRDLLNRLEGASDIEKAKIYGEIDPKLALNFEIAKDKEKSKLQTQQFIAQQYAQDFGGAPPEVPEQEEFQGAGLGGPQAKITQPVSPESATATQPGFKPNAPSMAARNATALNANMPFSKDFTGQPLTQVPQGTMPPSQQIQQRPPEQLTPAQLRAKGAALEGMQHGAGKGYFDTAKAIEANDRENKKIESDKKIASDKERVRFDKGQEKTYSKIQNDAEHAQSHLKSSAQARKSIASGNVGNKGISGLKRAFFKGSKWEDYFKNEDHALLEAAALEDFQGMKDMFGTRLSDADLKVVSGKVISPYKSDEANLAIIEYREFQDKMKIAKAEIADEIIEENGGYKPFNFVKQIRERMSERYGKEADNVMEKALFEGKPSPKPSPQDPTMESIYGKVPQGQIRLKKGSEIITIPAAYLADALADDFVQLGGP